LGAITEVGSGTRREGKAGGMAAEAVVDSNKRELENRQLEKKEKKAPVTGLIIAGVVGD